MHDESISELLEESKRYWTRPDFYLTVVSGFALFAISLIINYFAGSYATSSMGNPVKDLILDNIPKYNVDLIFIDGAILFYIFVALMTVYSPKKIPYVIKSVSLFILIRSFFIILTHIGPYPEHSPFEMNNILNKIIFGGDMFFSGHTGLPFLLALIFWDSKPLRYVFISASAIFAIAVLLGHLHYSIDVFGAYFITYSIYIISRKFFAKDLKLFCSVGTARKEAKIHT
jgi:hypothetical protein